jgi:hypothetical protein
MTVDGTAPIATEGTSEGVSDRLPKLVVPTTIPAKPVAAEGVIFPAADAEDNACTCRPTTVNVSINVVAETIKFIVKDVVVNPPLKIAVMFLPAVKARVGAAAVLKRQPVGALMVNVRKPALISVATPSATVILPKVV